MQVTTYLNSLTNIGKWVRELPNQLGGESRFTLSLTLRNSRYRKFMIDHKPHERDVLGWSHFE